MEKIVSIRGAITIKKNNIKEIKDATCILISELVKQNNLNESKIINVIFTATNDLDSVNPATIAREEFKLDSIPMLCVQEMKVKNGLPKCIRVMINVYTSSSGEMIKHVYIGGAESLRPDLTV